MHRPQSAAVLDEVGRDPQGAPPVDPHDREPDHHARPDGGRRRRRSSEGPESSSRWSRRIDLVTLVLVVASAGLFQTTDRVNQFFVANADNLLLAELFEDLAAGGSLADWYLPYSPYFAPDWLIYGFTVLITGTEKVRLGLFAIVQFAVLMSATASISRSVTARYQWGATSAVAALAVLGAALEVKPFIFLAAPFVHFGTFALMLWLIALTLRYLTDDRAVRWLVMSLAIGAALMASDRIIAVWFHLPAAMAIFAWGWRQDRRRAAIWIGSHAAVLLAAVPLPGLIRTRESAYDLALSPGSASPLAGANRVWRSFLDAGAESGWWFWIALAVLPIVLLLLLRGRALLGGSSFQPDAKRFLTVFVPASAVTTVIAQVMLTGSVAPGPRYNMTILFLPLLLLAALVPPRQPNGGHRALLAVPVAGALLWSATALDEIDPGGPDHLACIQRQLERSGSENGVASYWDARDLVVYLDDPDVGVGTYDLFGRPERINVSSASYRDRYDFVVRSERVPLWALDLGMIRTVNGPPEVAIECGIYTLWDYGPGGLTMEPLSRPGDVVTFDGCALDTQVGTLRPRDCVLATTGQAGYLNFGPYRAVPTGRYQVDLAYRAEGDVPIGSWDLAVFHHHGDIPSIVKEGPLEGTDGRIGHVRFEWTATDLPTGELTVAEVRTVVKADMTGEIISIELTRIG